ncbi:hypothetical protein [Nonomuraea sp. NPDC049709]|uniref:hypothetical protein n=1 Tax=Nonomuraea sp. NPDC049709 TaxID=3154736 RepID=UPI003413BAC6
MTMALDKPITWKWNMIGARGIAAAAVAAALGAGLVGAVATPAQADVYNCTDYIERQINTAVARCASGFGGYRVAAKCNSAHWPYTRTVVGPWRSPGTTTSSSASGNTWGCTIVDSWVQAR